VSSRRLVLLVALLVGCGSKNQALDLDARPTLDGRIRPDAHAIDADLSACVAGKPQCSDGCDNDNDGLIDGDDPECTGAIDRREDSFATGIPGDNMDPTKQDCFFDGNSGQGGGDCQIHVCCILAGDPDCPAEHANPPYDPSACATAVDASCKAYCEPITPPGCDCFGCCTVCDGDGCTDIYTNPAVAPDCDQDAIHDPARCPACVKNAACGSPCGGTSCVLCPGQDPSALPASCGGTSACPGGLSACTATADCGPTQYCANNCCIAVVN
jgi:hypothetical protein